MRPPRSLRGKHPGFSHIIQKKTAPRASKNAYLVVYHLPQSYECTSGPIWGLSEKSVFSPKMGLRFRPGGARGGLGVWVRREEEHKNSPRASKNAYLVVYHLPQSYECTSGPIWGLSEKSIFSPKMGLRFRPGGAPGGLGVLAGRGGVGAVNRLDLAIQILWRGKRGVV